MSFFKEDGPVKVLDKEKLSPQEYETLKKVGFPQIVKRGYSVFRRTVKKLRNETTGKRFESQQPFAVGQVSYITKLTKIAKNNPILKSSQNAAYDFVDVTNSLDKEIQSWIDKFSTPKPTANAVVKEEDEEKEEKPKGPNKNEQRYIDFYNENKEGMSLKEMAEALKIKPATLEKALKKHKIV